MWKENEIFVCISVSCPSQRKQTVPSRHNTFNVYCLFGTYIFAFTAAEANLFVDYLQQTITNPQTENRTDLRASPAATAVIKNFNSRFHCLQTIKALYGLGSGSPFDTMNDEEWTTDDEQRTKNKEQKR
jgi:hypothetical protein